MKKKNKSDTTTVQVVGKAGGRFRSARSRRCKGFCRVYLEERHRMHDRTSIVRTVQIFGELPNEREIDLAVYLH